MKEKATTTRVRLDPVNPPSQADRPIIEPMSDAEIHAAAASDPDAQPATAEQLARARRRVDVRFIRERLGLSQAVFAQRFGLRLETVQAWEDGSVAPDATAISLLRVIWAEPETVRRIVAAE